MKASVIYRNAARSLEKRLYDSPYACDQIGASCGLYTKNTTDQNRALFRRLRDRFAEAFGQDPSSHVWWPDPYHNKGKGPRIIALCFMAAIAEDEERSSRGR